MSITGSIDLYQTLRGKGTLRTRLRAAASAAGSTSALIIVRSRFPFTERRNEPKPDDLHTWTIDEVCSMRLGTGTMDVHLSLSDRMRDFYEALKREIPNDIADNFYPADPIVRLGWHLIDNLPLPDRGPDPTQRHPARFSLSLFGYSCPKNWDEYRRRIFQTNAVRELEAEFVEAIGPVKRAISWSV